MVAKKTYRIIISLFIVVLLGLVGCQPKERPSGIPSGFRALPSSNIVMDIKLPVAALEAGLNQSLAYTLADESIQLNGRKDSLFLEITRTRDIQLAYKKQLIYAAIPIKVKAVLKKKVLGLVLTNADQPLTFTATATIAGPFTLDEKWQPIYDFKWRGLEWEEPPVFDLMGFRLDLTEIIASQIQAIIPNLNDKINTAVASGARLSENIENAFTRIQEPILLNIAEDVHFLNFNITEIKGSVISDRDDTLTLKVESDLEATLLHNKPTTGPIRLPIRKAVTQSKNQFDIYLEAPVSFHYLNERGQILKGQSFSYEGTSVSIESLFFYPKEGYIHCDVTFAGDESGSVMLYGIPHWGADRTLQIKHFGYELKEGSEWLSLTDATLHGTFEKMIQKSLSYSVDQEMSKLGATIHQVIEKSKIGSKLDLNLTIHDLSLFDIGLTDQEIQFIINVRGNAEIQLEKGLFRPRVKP